MAKISVVGAGIGGMSAAARLAKQGHQVTVFENSDQSGGNVELNGSAIMHLIPAHLY